MQSQIDYLPHKVTSETDDDGTTLLRSGHKLGPMSQTTGAWLQYWGTAAPDRVFLAERAGPGWRRVSYREALQWVEALAAGLLGRGIGPDQPIAVLTGNSINHGLLALAAQAIGAPVASLPPYLAQDPEALNGLRHAVALVRPRMVFAERAATCAEALESGIFDGVEIVTCDRGGHTATTLADLARGDASSDLAAARANVGPDTLCRIFLTSGATAAPKAVLTTHEMLCANQAQLQTVLPFLKRRPPVLVNWLPWSHAFGGALAFNAVLANGGSLYIDDASPGTEGAGSRGKGAAKISATCVCDTPQGLAQLVTRMRSDDGLRRHVFSRLDLILSSGGVLPRTLRHEIAGMADAEGRRPLVAAFWGMTEAAPAAVLQHAPCDHAGFVGVPLPGVTVKLIPDDGMRSEVQIAGPTVTPGYRDDPEATADAFNSEGFFVTGDAVMPVDPSDWSQGLRFDGRLTDAFQLTDGTFVRVPGLRLELLACLSPLAEDVVLCGAGHGEVGLLIFPDRAALAAAGYGTDSDGGGLIDDRLLAEIRHRLTDRAAHAPGGGAGIARALVLAEPAQPASGEVSVNRQVIPRQVLASRAALVARLYAGGVGVVEM